MVLKNNQQLSIDDLLQIKLPLSDEDYKTLYEELQKSRIPLSRVSMNLWRAFYKKAEEIHNLRHPNNGCEEIPWEPPLTEEEKAKFGIK